MLKANECVFVLIDVQGKLARMMYQPGQLFTNLAIILKGMALLNIPIIWTEQNPEKTGATIPELSALLKNEKPIAKTSFSCWGEAVFRDRLKSMNRPKVLLAGIETHICVYLTAFDLQENGFEPIVLVDCTSSRKSENKTAAIDQLRHASIQTTCTETALFDILNNSEHPAFRDVLRLVK